MRLRIYYESLEQANNYIKPMVSEIIDASDIILVKRPGNIKNLFPGAVRAINLLTTPDILITGIEDGKETPLVLLEFSEAVTTEDHELQRTYGAVASYLANMFYIKISGEKESEKVFGGAEYNPYSTPKILFDEFGYEGYIIANWDTIAENRFTLLRNCNFPSCPPPIDILEATIQLAIIAFRKNRQDWFANSLVLLKETESYQQFRELVEKAEGSDTLLRSWKGREERNRNRNKLRYFVTDDWVGAKINRFSHAMDPDRGILTFISFVFSAERKIFGIYALVRPRGNEILKKEVTDLNSLKEKLAHALEKDSSGIPVWFVNEIKEAIDGANAIDQEIDFHEAWERNKDKIPLNKVVATIAYFLDGMYLNHNGLRLIWNRKRLLGDEESEFTQLLKIKHGFGTNGRPAQIKEFDGAVNEDEVTYAIVHRVLLPNKFRIVSISYPGAQGGGAILPNPDLGKAQPREYPDIIAMPPEANDNLGVVLGESKGKFSQASLERDVSKLLRYKTENGLRKALRESLMVAEVIDKNDELRNIAVGVAFGVSPKQKTTWQPGNVDFIFRITGRRKWSIGIFNQALKELIPFIEGDTNFPDVFCVTKFDDNLPNCSLAEI